MVATKTAVARNEFQGLGNEFRWTRDEITYQDDLRESEVSRDFDTGSSEIDLIGRGT